MKTSIIDFGGLTHSSFFVSNGQKDMNTKEKYAYWRYLILNQIRKFKVQFKPDELIIACDKFSWRKTYFKFYKASRSIARKKSTIDWEMFYSELDKFLNELKETFIAYKIIEIEKCEADDIIAIIVHGLRSIRKEIIIISPDHDFKQLIGNNVKQYDPRKQQFIECKNPKEYLLKHIMGGDSGDGIANLRSDDDVFVDSSKRQKSFGPKTITKILIYGLQKYIDENNLQKNWDRNRKLIELSKDMIPLKIQKDIYKKYKKCKNVKNSFSTVQKYLASSRFRSLIEKADQF